MARPQKLGIDYFPLDVDIDQDDKIQLVEALHGTTGFAVIIKLFMRIYKEGYYYKWTETEQLLFSRRVNVDINSLTEIVNDCIKYELFCSNLFHKYRILTSPGIQQRYFEASKRRKSITVIDEFLLVDPSKFINANINRDNADIVHTGNAETSTETPQSKVKESKVKESKQQQHEHEKNEPERKPVVGVDADFAKVTNFYADNIGPLNAAISDELNAMCDFLNAELVLLALRESVLANAGNKIKYTHSILKSWKAQNFKTALDVDQHEKRKEQLGNKQTQNRYSNNGKSEVIPDWFSQRNADDNQSNSDNDIDIEAKRRDVQARINSLGGQANDNVHRHIRNS